MPVSRVTQKMKAADAAWLRMERPVNPMTITGVMMTGTPMPRATLIRLIEERLLVYRRFRMYVDGPNTSSPSWVLEEPFDIDAHIIPYRLPEPGDQNALEWAVSDLMSQPMSFDSAPWTIHHVEQFGEGSALIVRLHHCIGDGIALMHVLLSLSDELWDPSTIKLPSMAKRRSLGQRVARGTANAAKATGRALSRPGTIGRGLVFSGKSSAALAGLLAMSADTRTVFKRGVSEQKRAAWSKPIPLSTIKTIGAATGTKVNDVLLAVAAGGLGRFLENQGDTTDGVEIRAAVPFNIRPRDKAHELGNVFALVFLALPVGVKDPTERLRLLKTRMDAMKKSAQPAVVFAILQSIGFAPDWAHKLVVKIFSSKCSAVMTNVPGPTEKLHLLGVPLDGIMFWVPQAGDIGLGLSILSYNDTVLVGVTTDVNIVPDPNLLVTEFEAEFDALAARYASSPDGG